MPFPSHLPKLARGAIALAAVACGGGNSASQTAKPPEYSPANQSKCAVRASQSEPLIVEWAPAERGRLEASVRHGLVAVRYVGCEMRLVTQCRVRDSEYKYAPVTRKNDSVRIKNEDDLYANLPTGAVRFEAKLRNAGQLNVQMTMVGRYESTRATVGRSDLEGACDEVTHVVTAMTVGAFSFFAGSDAQVGGGVSGFGAGAGGSSAASREMLTQDGDEASCARASGHDTVPPDGCGALIRLEVAEVTAAQSARVAPRPIDPEGDEPTPSRPRPTATEPPRPAPTANPTATPTPTEGDKGAAGKIAAWTALGALAVSGIVGTIALSIAKTATDPQGSSPNCSKDHNFCNADGLAAKDRAHALALTADGFLLLGVAAAVTYYFLPVKPPAGTSVGVAPVPGGGAAIGVGGKF